MSALYHPSIFQNPALDVAFNKDRALVTETNPTTIWRKSPAKIGGKPFTREEKISILSGITLCTNLNINKDLLPLLLPVFMSTRNLEALQRDIVIAVRN